MPPSRQLEASEALSHGPAAHSCTLTVPSAIESLAAVRDFVAASAAALGIPDHDAHHFQLAAEEACTNIIHHGVAGLRGADSAILLELTSHATGWTLTIRDRGRPFDPASLPSPDLRASLRRRRPGGLGVYLIRSLMDDVCYHSSDGENRLSLTRRRA